MKKLNKSYFILIICLINSSNLLSEITPKFGLNTDFSYIDINSKVPINILSNDTYFYLGLEYIEDNFFISIKPAIRIYTKTDITVFPNTLTENKEHISFIFDEAVFAYLNEYLSFYLGKRKFHFGEGFSRQYIFVDRSVLYNDIQSLYNIEIVLYNGNMSYSLGFIPDTVSLDNFKKPQYYKSWLYAKYSISSFLAMAIIEYKYHIEEKNSIRTGIEFSYIFNLGLKLYGNFSYDILYKNNIDTDINKIKSLIGASYTFLYEDKINFSPFAEYFFEYSRSFYSIGFFMSFLDGLIDITFSFLHSPNYEIDIISKLEFNIKDLTVSLDYIESPKNYSQISRSLQLKLNYSY